MFLERRHHSGGIVSRSDSPWESGLPKSPLNRIMLPLGTATATRRRRAAALLVLCLPTIHSHGDDDAHTHLVNSISDCPDATWSYRDHKCYKLTHEWHTFDECNRVYCPYSLPVILQ